MPFFHLALLWEGFCCDFVSIDFTLDLAALTASIPEVNDTA